MHIVMGVSQHCRHVEARKGSLAQTLEFQSLITVIFLLVGDPEGSPLKIAIRVYYVEDKSDDTAFL